jgi:hypothetical protein
MVAAKTAVAPPTQATTAEAGTEAAYKPLNRQTI